jgi:hypothetical protein
MNTRARAPETLTERDILRFWGPLAATWLMMSVEGPFIAAIIARLADPVHNLAAYGVAFSFALLVESPIVMALSAATALVRDRQSFLTLRRFIYALNVAITAAMLVLLAPSLFRWIATALVGLPEPVARLTYQAMAILLPWPAAIGYRRFYQGVLVRHKMTRRVAYGTVVRLTSMAGVAILLDALTSLPGALVGASALSAGVVMEAAATRYMARGVVRELLKGPALPDAGIPALTTRRVVTFYSPLAMTSILAFGTAPLLTFFLGHGRLPLESLAVLPVVMSLVFLFRSGGIAYQEVAIALLGDRREHVAPLAAFAKKIGGVLTLALAVVAFTPLGTLWFQRVSGLSADLAPLAVLSARILTLLPALEVLLSLQRGLLVHAHRTRLITWATAIEVGTIVAVLLAGVAAFDLVGVVAAALGLLLGRVASTAFLAGPALGKPAAGT